MAKMDPVIYKAANKARVALAHGEKTLIVIRDEKQLHFSTERGMKPLLDIIDKDVELLNGSIVGDRIVGRAAAFLCIYGKARAVYASSMSDEAIELFEKYDILPTWQDAVPYIVERDLKSRYKLDLHVKDVEDPAVAVQMIRDYVEQGG